MDYEYISTSTTFSDSSQSVELTTECIVSESLNSETLRAQTVEIGSCAMVAAFTLLCLGVVLWR